MFRIRMRFIEIRTLRHIKFECFETDTESNTSHGYIFFIRVVINLLLYREMGQPIPRVETTKILMLGLDDAGKTAILYRLSRDEVVTCIPTTGFNVENIDHKTFQFTVWDIRGGGPTDRLLWKSYYTNKQALIFVIDASDKERLGTAKSELEKVLADEELQDVPLLVFANKMDLKVMNVSEVEEGLDLKAIKNRN